MKGAITAVLIITVLGVGGWYYINRVHSTEISRIVSNPRDYAGKEITISGTVADRFSFLVLKYFNLSDSTGNITVVTDKPLPATGSKIRVKGRVKEEFSLGDKQVLVFQESPF